METLSRTFRQTDPRLMDPDLVLDLTHRIKASYISSLLVEYFRRWEDSGEVYWATASSWASDLNLVRPNANDVLLFGLSKGGNEGYHISIMAYLDFVNDLSDPRWFTLVTVKVWTKEAGARIIAELTSALADKFVW